MKHGKPKILILNIPLLAKIFSKSKASTDKHPETRLDLDRK